MWDCPACGCQAIAPDLAFCPQCFENRPEEGAVPKTTTAGSSNAWEEQEMASGPDQAEEQQTAGQEEAAGTETPDPAPKTPPKAAAAPAKPAAASTTPDPKPH